MLKPKMSASISPTSNPRLASSTATFAVIVLLPTPPLPEPKRNTLLDVPTWNGFVRGAALPRSLLLSSANSSEVITCI